MNARALLLAGAVAVLAGCNQGTETTANQANAAAKAAAAKPKHPTYCFFKDSDTKGWAASRDVAGNISVKGKGHLDDNRYAAELSQPEISGTSASLWLMTLGGLWCCLWRRHWRLVRLAGRPAAGAADHRLGARYR